MQFTISYCTDKGIRKGTNQDALLAKVTNTIKGRVALFAICDGMGGLEDGELASASVINSLKSWYENQLVQLLDREDSEIVESLIGTVYEINEKLIDHSIKTGKRLGTTLTAILCLYDKYYTIQVGDSRAYKIRNNVEVLTKDQTFVAREVERGNITAEQAKNHPKRNVLLQCIGASNNMEPVVTEGILEKNSMYMICSDGLYHKISNDEILKLFNFERNSTENIMNITARDTVELVKSRKETDNISVLMIKVF